MPKPPLERQLDNPWPEWPKTFKVDYGQEEAALVQGDDPRIADGFMVVVLEEGHQGFTLDIVLICPVETYLDAALLVSSVHPVVDHVIVDG